MPALLGQPAWGYVIDLVVPSVWRPNIFEMDLLTMVRFSRCSRVSFRRFLGLSTGAMFSSSSKVRDVASTNLMGALRRDCKACS